MNSECGMRSGCGHDTNCTREKGKLRKIKLLVAKWAGMEEGIGARAIRCATRVLSARPQSLDPMLRRTKQLKELPQKNT